MKYRPAFGIFVSCAVAALSAQSSFASPKDLPPAASAETALGRCTEANDSLVMKKRHYLTLGKTADGQVHVNHYLEYGDGAPITPLKFDSEKPAAKPDQFHVGQTPTWSDLFHADTKTDGAPDQDAKSGLFSGTAGSLFGGTSECTASLRTDQGGRSFQLTQVKAPAVIDKMVGTPDDEKNQETYSLVLSDNGSSQAYRCQLVTESFPKALKCTEGSKSEKKTGARVFEKTEKVAQPENTDGETSPHSGDAKSTLGR